MSDVEEAFDDDVDADDDAVDNDDGADEERADLVGQDEDVLEGRLSDERDDEEDEDKEKDDDEEDKEEEEKYPDTLLTLADMSDCLSLLCKTGDGLAHAFVRLDATGRQLTDIQILSTYIHLRYVDLSENNLRDVSALNSLSNLLTLQLTDNKLTTASQPFNLPYLQLANFSKNKIRSLSGIHHPLLEHLNVNMNQISTPITLEPEHLSRLHTLELRENNLTSLAGLSLPNLKHLYLAANQIKSLEGLDRLVNLVTLHLRENQLENLDNISDKLKYIQYINLRSNQIADMKEIRKLGCLQSLKSLVLSDNTVTEQDDYRLEVLVAVATLDRLDKDAYAADEKEAADAVRKERREEEEMMAVEESKEGLPVGDDAMTVSATEE